MENSEVFKQAFTKLFKEFKDSTANPGGRQLVIYGSRGSHTQLNEATYAWIQNEMTRMKDDIYKESMDALGQPMELGAVYGYSQSNAGLISITIGVLEELVYQGFRQYKAKLRVVERRWGYGFKNEQRKIERKVAYTNTAGLFKLVNYDLHEETEED